MSVRVISGEAHFFEENLNIERIKKLLDNRTGIAGTSEKLEGMKSLLAMISKGQDVSVFFPDVVKNVIVPSVELKKLVYIFLVHYADHDANCRELALLSINSFQKDLADSNQLIRALALRVMTSIRVPDIIQIQVIAVQKCASDSSPYVRKAAANAISKIYSIDPSEGQKDQLEDIIGKLLHDGSAMVLGSAVQALNDVCPDRTDLLHGSYRKLCNVLADLDEWGQTVTLDVLMRYCRENFVNKTPAFDEGASSLLQGPLSTSSHGFSSSSSSAFSMGSLVGGGQQGEAQADASKKKRRKKRGRRRSGSAGSDSESSEASSEPSAASSAYSSSASSSVFALSSSYGKPAGLASSSSFGVSPAAAGALVAEELDADLRLLLRCSLPLLKSRNSGVVLAVVALHWYCGTRSAATAALLGKSLVRISRARREIQMVVLSCIASMSQTRPDMFAPFLTDFLVKATDASHARARKLDILTHLATEETVSLILREFQTYVRHPDEAFVKHTIHAVGRVAQRVPSAFADCLRGLVTLALASSKEAVAAEAVVVIRQLLQQRPGQDDAAAVVAALAPLLSRVASPACRAAIVWMLGEFRERLFQSSAGDRAALPCEALRLLARSFSEESPEVKMQIVNLAVKLSLSLSAGAGASASTSTSTAFAQGLRSKTRETVQQLLQYILELAKFDVDYDIRDRSRMLRVMLSNSFSAASSSSSSSPSASASSSSSSTTTTPSSSSSAASKAADALPQGVEDIRDILLAAKPPPLVELGCKQSTFTLGSLSSVVDKKCNGYHALPPWSLTPSDPALRSGGGEGPGYTVDEKKPWGTRKTPHAHTRKHTKADSRFYSSESSSSSSSGSGESGSSDSESDSDSEEEESSSGSEAESEDSDEDPSSSADSSSSEGVSSSTGRREEDSSDDSSEDSSEAESSSSSSGDDGSGSSSDEEEDADTEDRRRRKARGVVEGARLGRRRADKSKSKSKSKRRNNAEASAARPSSSSSSSNGGEADLLALSPTPPVLGAGPQPASDPFDFLSSSTASVHGLDASAGAPASVVSGLEALRFSEADSTMDELLSHFNGGGLQVDYVFTRESSSLPSTMTPLRLRLTNKTNAPLQDVSIELAPSGNHPHTSMAAFEPVALLEPSGSASASLFVSFGGVSRLVRLLALTHKGKFEMSLLPPPGELAAPLSLTLAEFKALEAKLSKHYTGRSGGGGTQREVEFTLESPHEQFAQTPQRVLRGVNAFAVIDHSRTGIFTNSGVCRFACVNTTEKQDPVLITVQVKQENGFGKIQVLSKAAEFAEQLLFALKKDLTKTEKS